MGKTAKIRDLSLRLESLKPSMDKDFFDHFLKNYSLKVKYEAIIDLETMKPFAYEALSVFTLGDESINVESLFKNIHQFDGYFFALEKEVKKEQIRRFPYDTRLFLNFDGDVFETVEQREYWKSFLTPHKERIGIEITENSSKDHVKLLHMKMLSLWLKNLEFHQALDDFLQEETMYSFKLLLSVDYIKIDRAVLREVLKNPHYLEIVKGVVKFGKGQNKKVIIEGVETLKELEIAQEIEADYVQGYHFKFLEMII